MSHRFKMPVKIWRLFSGLSSLTPLPVAFPADVVALGAIWLPRSSENDSALRFIYVLMIMMDDMAGFDDYRELKLLHFARFLLRLGLIA